MISYTVDTLKREKTPGRCSLSSVIHNKAYNFGKSVFKETIPPKTDVCLPSLIYSNMNNLNYTNSGLHEILNYVSILICDIS